MYFRNIAAQVEMSMLYELMVLPYRVFESLVRAFCKVTCRIRINGYRDKRRKCAVSVISVFVTYYLYQTLTMPVRFLFVNDNVDKQCIIPDLDPFDKSVMKYVWSPDPIQCNPIPDLLFVNEQGILQYNQSALSQYNGASFTCAFSMLKLKPGDDYSVYFEEEVKFEPPVVVPSDFFRVRCKNSRRDVVYDNLHESIYTGSVFQRKTIKPENSSGYSVFMFGIDSTSRLAAMRKLTKTYRYLTDALQAFIFKGYMKVGDNTFPNLLPVLTGKRPWTDDLPKLNYKDHFVDTLVHFLWSNFSAANYATLYAEDYPIIATFNTEAGGFKEQPTDHYMRPWMLGMKKVGFASEVLKSVLLPFEYNNINLKKTSSLCFGTKPVHKHLINYYKRFAAKYSGKLRFGFSWLTQICHEFVNYLELGDDDFMEFFKFLKDKGHLKNSFLIFFSDHGSRIDDIRNTFVGRIEERMPLLSIVPPESFIIKHTSLIKNLKDNTERLTSNFDLHETLKDILQNNFDRSEDHFSDSKSVSRGTSLFKPISVTRSCAEASIPEHFCACYGSRKLSNTDHMVQNVAQFCVNHLNKILHKYTDICAELSLIKVHEAEQISLGLSARGEEESRWTLYKFISKPEVEKHKRFLVVFETVPGNAMFEATVNFHTDNGMEMLDEVSRTNKYGNTSACVPEKPLRRYCFCKSQLQFSRYNTSNRTILAN